jgi:hypothetical protein
MGTTIGQVGPLTVADLQAIWEGVVDESYSRAFEDAGEGNGFEAYTQAWAQMGRVSTAVDLTTQSMYILPWSGQTADPASGPKLATVTLTLSRTGLLQLPLVLSAGTLVEEQQTDWGPNGGVPVLTGRRYALATDLTFEPGQQGPLDVPATAERPGWGYNNPMPGTLVVVDQPGTNFGNVDATVRGANYPGGPVAPGIVWQVLVDALDQADAFIPDHVGQYLLFEAGANAGRIGRIVSYLPPDLSLSPPTGGTVRLELVQSVRSFATHYTGTFAEDELLTLKNGAAVTGYGRLIDAQVLGADLYLTFTRQSGLAVTTVVGQFSGASATIDFVELTLDFALETFDATWRILDWATDWGLVVTNKLAPTGGRAGMLDALGKERDIYRSPNETDDAYRLRVAAVADVVSPNAIMRTLNRTIPGVPWCFREVGQRAYPGFFFDYTGGSSAVPSAAPNAYDMDFTRFTTGAITGAFVDGEVVTQVVVGVVTSARARVTFPAVVSTPGPLVGPPVFRGVAGVHGPPFVPGSPVVGQKSGATFTPSAVFGGLNPANRYRVWFGYTEMRAWFFVDVPNLDAGDSGFAYDDHPTGAYDAGPLFDDFYDGQPWVAATQRIALWNAIEKVRAGGVGWTLQLATGPCP